MSGAHVHDVHVSKKIKCENPFPNWKPITKISYIELDIIVSRLVFPLANSHTLSTIQGNASNNFDGLFKDM